MSDPLPDRRIGLIGGGRQVAVMPGTTPDRLEKALRPIGREPHSVKIWG